jgi:hypothetical protein
MEPKKKWLAATSRFQPGKRFVGEQAGVAELIQIPRRDSQLKHPLFLARVQESSEPPMKPCRRAANKIGRKASRPVSFFKKAFRQSLPRGSGKRRSVVHRRVGGRHQCRHSDTRPSPGCARLRKYE